MAMTEQEGEKKGKENSIFPDHVGWDICWKKKGNKLGVSGKTLEDLLREMGISSQRQTKGLFDGIKAQ